MIIPRTPIGVLLVLATTVADDACRAQFEAIDDPICSNGRTYASWGDAWCAGATARWTRGACENDARVLAETPFGHDGGTHDAAQPPPPPCCCGGGAAEDGRVVERPLGTHHPLGAGGCERGEQLA